MKKILLMLCVFIVTTGCVNIKKEDYKNIINTAIKENNDNKIKHDFNDKTYIFNYKNNNGYLNIKEIENKYLVEILYNYAKIEVRVNKFDINQAINNSIIILSTIKYDDKIIENLISENKLIGDEETLNIFKNEVDKDNFMDVIEEYDKYEDESDIPDYDIINKED